MSCSASREVDRALFVSSGHPFWLSPLGCRILRRCGEAGFAFIYNLGTRCNEFANKSRSSIRALVLGPSDIREGEET